jgi:hypothetical protein
MKLTRYGYLSDKELSKFNEYLKHSDIWLSDYLADKYSVDKYKTINGWKVSIGSILLEPFFKKLYTYETLKR